MLIFESNDFKKIENFGPSFIRSIISHSSFLSPQSSSYISHSPLPIVHLPFSIPHSPLPTPHSPLPTPHSPFSSLHSSFSPLLPIHYPVPDPHSRFSIIPFKLGISLPWRNFENPKWSSNFCVNWVRMIHGLARIINRKGEKIINAHSLYRGLAEFTNQITIVRHAANHMEAIFITCWSLHRAACSSCRSLFV